jgi:hypothetical protein
VRVKNQKGVKMQNHGRNSIQKMIKSVLVLFSLFTLLHAASVEATLSNTEVVQGISQYP